MIGSVTAAVLLSREDVISDQGIVSVMERNGSESANRTKPTLPLLQLDKLVRTGVEEPLSDPFAQKSGMTLPIPPVAVAPPQPEQDIPKPVAPPLPFAYMGRMQEEGGKEVIYLTQGTQAYSVNEGDIIEGTYRVDTISTKQITLTYLPMDFKQTLDISDAQQK